MRLLGVDYGFRRIGIAVGESETEIASPRAALSARGSLAKDAAAIFEVARSEGVETVVVGVPRNEPDDRMERVCLKLAVELATLGIHVETEDETLTTQEANANLASAKGARRRKLRDGEAARILLERYFRAHA